MMENNQNINSCLIEKQNWKLYSTKKKQYKVKINFIKQHYYISINSTTWWFISALITQYTEDLFFKNIYRVVMVTIWLKSKSHLSLAPLYWYVAVLKIWRNFIMGHWHENGNYVTMKALKNLKLNCFAYYEESDWSKRVINHIIK